MNLHTLEGTGEKGKKRIGRGGKRGTYSGRGQKGQKSRAGRRIRPASRDLLLRTPKRKGFNNKRKSVPTISLSLTAIQKMKEQKITPQVLMDMRIIRNAGQRVKILASGEITDAKEISGIEVSKSAGEKIKKAGGTVAKK